jgi:hypothetical protein
MPKWAVTKIIIIAFKRAYMKAYKSERLKKMQVHCGSSYKGEREMIAGALALDE